MHDISLITGSSQLLPVLTVSSAQQGVELARALHAGGVVMVEITLRTPAALETIAAIKSQLPQLIVAAGTVVSGADASAVKDAGVDFAVSPASSHRLFDAVEEIDLPFLPGVATPSEVLAGLERGYSHFKLFPAEAVGGVPLIKSMGGPLPAAKFCPTGGLSPLNAAAYLSLKNVFCIGGSWMVPSQLVASEQWEAITELTAQAVALT
jgi:2-dehydro-3-deoxyphosphogluconate aldolase/(4S)-4-hydroxy-2-oxoglutarate aldolase